MDCDAIREMLSSYVDNVTSHEEEAKIHNHLSTCRECEKYLADLKKSVRLVNELEDVEPPEWVQERVMEQIREGKREKKSFIERLLHPPFAPLPLGTAAALFIVIGALFLFRSTKKEIRFTPPMSEERAELPTRKAAPSMGISALKKSPAPREEVTSGITLSVNNPAESETRIEKRALKLGGSIIFRRRKEKATTLVVLIDSRKLDEFIALVKEEGILKEPFTRKGPRLREGKSTLKITLIPLKSR